ncbi:MAG: hypothetical protein RL095_1678 [Verrucomicrobiota bacterium]
MRLPSSLPLELMEDFRRARTRGAIAEMLSLRLGRILPVPALELCWGMRGRETVEVELCRRGAARELVSRDPGTSAMTEILSSEEAFIATDFRDEMEGLFLEEKKAAAMKAALLILLPLFDRKGVNGFLTLYFSEAVDPDKISHFLAQLSSILGVMLSREDLLRKTAAVSRQGWKGLLEQNRSREEQSDERADGTELVMESQAMQNLWKKALLNRNKALLAIKGADGSGKSFLARALHKKSSRRRRSFLRLEVPERGVSDLTRDLLGDAAGEGLKASFEAGTLVLSLSPGLSQEDLASAVEIARRFLKEKSEVTVIFTASADALFPGDVECLSMPALEHRRDDLAWLVRSLVSEQAGRLGLAVPEARPEFMKSLLRREWKGQVEELKSWLEKCLIASDGRILRDPEDEVSDFAPGGRTGRPPRTLEESVKSKIQQVLKRSKGKVYGEDGAAAMLDMNPSTLLSKMKKLGIDAEKFRKS